MWESLFATMMRRFVRTGSISVVFPGGRTRTFGQGDDSIGIRITSRAALRSLVLRPEMAVGECYMDRTLTVDGDRLGDLIRLLILNRNAGGLGAWGRVMTASRIARRRLMMYNPVPRAARNAAHHYDIDYRLYSLFLDEDRQYSCAYFTSPGDTLEQAQRNKKAHIARKLLIEPDQRVLDIGCGWGGMGLTLAAEHGAEVLGVTLSKEQLAVARDRARARHLDGRVRFELQDYRHVEGRFDRIVSVGMFEHVGVPHYRAYFRKVARLLADDGIALIHTIGHIGAPQAANPWINRYIFPGGYAPSMSEVTAAIDASGLVVNDVEVWRLHYAETLKAWHDRFTANIDRARELYDDTFCRMWRFYLVSMERSFREGTMLVHQYQLSRRNDVVPVTRDYLYRDAEAAAQPRLVAE